MICITRSRAGQTTSNVSSVTYLWLELLLLICWRRPECASSFPHQGHRPTSLNKGRKASSRLFPSLASRRLFCFYMSHPRSVNSLGHACDDPSPSFFATCILLLRSDAAAAALVLVAPPCQVQVKPCLPPPPERKRIHHHHRESKEDARVSS